MDDLRDEPALGSNPRSIGLEAIQGVLNILADEFVRLRLTFETAEDKALLQALLVEVEGLRYTRDAIVAMDGGPTALDLRYARVLQRLRSDLASVAGRGMGALELVQIVAVSLKELKSVTPPAGVPVPAPAPINPSDFHTKGMMLDGAAPATASFSAHPRLAVDGPLVGQQEFRIVVGFSSTADTDADFTTPIEVADAKPGETMDVLISASGATLLETWKVVLALDLSDERAIRARVHPDAGEVKLAANYLFRGRPMGSIGKTISVVQPRMAAAVAARADMPGWLPALGNAAAIASIDVFLIVQQQGPDALEWKAYVPATGLTKGPYMVALRDTTAFAKKLAGIAAAGALQDDNGLLDVVDVGQTVAALVPPAIVDDVLTPSFAQGRTPMVLLLTDEPFVPWELARLDAVQAARSKPAFLGEVACMGRWWLRASSTGPASTAQVQLLSAVAASTYDDGTNETLLHAIAERKTLVSKYKAKYRAKQVEARKEPIRKWLETPPVPGHIAHIALHGYSNPMAQEEGLILGDGSNLTPIRLSGEWQKGEPPRFSIVFLNACQVGTAGSRLGQMSGFPGVLIRNGVSGFIAPLWEVNDAVAAKVAERFYERALDKGEPVGETLRAIRAAPRMDDSITPLAYVYYGHPALRLSRRFGTA